MVVPGTEEVVIPPCHYTDAPRMSDRSMWPFQVLDAEFHVPGVTGNEPYQQLAAFYRAGGRSHIRAFCPTPSQFDIHFEEHPECFELDAQGDRNPHMLCWSHPNTLKELIKCDVPHRQRLNPYHDSVVQKMQCAAE